MASVGGLRKKMNEYRTVGHFVCTLLVQAACWNCSSRAMMKLMGKHVR